MSLILVVLAVICFVLAAIGVNARVNLTAIGLALWAGSQLVGR